MIKKIGILILTSVLTLSVYAQKNAEEVVIEQKWQENHFRSDQSLLENLQDVKEMEQMLTVLLKGSIEALSTEEENLSVFLPLDIALEDLSRKQRKAFLEHSSKTELQQMWKEYIVPGHLDEHAIKRHIENKNGASIFVRTLGKNSLEFILKDGDIFIRDVYGNEAKWVKGDFYYTQGYFHFIDNLLFYEE